MKKEFTPYLLTLIVGVLFSAVVGVIIIFTGGGEVNFKGVLSSAADSTFVSGVLLLGIGGISFASRQGVFDAIGFSFESIFVVRNLSAKRRFKERENFSDYKERKTQSRKNKKGIAHYFVVGGIFLLLSIVLLIVYATI